MTRILWILAKIQKVKIMNISRLLEDFSSLNYHSQQELIGLLSKKLVEERPVLNHKKKPTNCPHCGCERLYRHGKYKITNGDTTTDTGGSRYRCRDCKKTFNELTGTSIHGLKKVDQFKDFVEYMFNGDSIRKIAKKLDLSTKTVFEWRHKTLISFEKVFTKKFKGIVETDDVIRRFNQKGRKNNFINIGKRKQGVNNDQDVSVMVSVDRYKTIDFKLVSYGKINSENLYRELDLNKFNDDNIVVSDKSRALVKFFDTMGFEHITFKSKYHAHPKFPIYHVNNLNNLVGRLTRWIKENFSSVSTKYLQNYLNYFLMLEILKEEEGVDKTDKWWNFMLNDTNTFKKSKSIEEKYQEFLSFKS
jgi:transposase-like protein